MDPEPYPGRNTGNTLKEHIMASPKAEFIVEDLISKICQKKYNDSRLPSERELAGQYHVSRYTIQKVMKQLIDMGLLISRQGSGIFVNEKMRGNPLVYNSATLVPYEDLQSQMIHLKKIPATPKQQKIFNLRETDMVWEFKRIRIMREDAELLNRKGNTPAFLIRSRGFLRGGAVFVSSRIIAVDYECTYVVPFNKDVFQKRRKKPLLF